MKLIIQSNKHKSVHGVCHGVLWIDCDDRRLLIEGLGDLKSPILDFFLGGGGGWVGSKIWKVLYFEVP